MIEVYQAEQIAGIADMVAKGSVSFASTIKSSIGGLAPSDLAAKFSAIATANPNQLDLYYKHSILASIGWNKNDDVFGKSQTWNARHTVSDKQLNLNHDEMQIVGHMTNSFVLDAKGNVIPDNTEVDKLPDMFDVVTEFVLYKIWADENRYDEIKKIIAKCDAGDGYVSMECRFPKFDYAIIDKDGNHKTVARTEETAFLSQHLKAFGGTGEYQGYKVGRLLQDFFFTGQGIVEHPANARSIIFDTGNKPFSSKASITIRDTQMDLETIKAELAAVKAELDATKAAKAKEITEAASAAIAKASTLATEKTALEGEVATVKSQVSDKDKAIAALTEELKAEKENVKTVATEVAAMKVEAKKVARAAQLAKTGIEADKIEATLAKWSTLNDEQFNDIVAMFPPKKDDEKKDDKKKDAAADKMDTAKCAADLAKAELEKTATLNQGASDTPDRMTVLANFLSAGLQYSANANARFEQAKK